MEKKKIYQINLDWATDSNDTDIAIREAKSIFPNCDISAEYYDYYNCIIITAVGTLDNLVPGLIKYFGPDMFSAIEFFAQDNDISNAEAKELLNRYWFEPKPQDTTLRESLTDDPGEYFSLLLE